MQLSGRKKNTLFPRISDWEADGFYSFWTVTIEGGLGFFSIHISSWFSFISISNNKHAPLDLLPLRRSCVRVFALGWVELGWAINTGWIPVNLGGMMGNRPREEPIKFQCSEKIEIGRAAARTQKQPTGGVKNAALIIFNKPWVDDNPAQPLI